MQIEIVDNIKTMKRYNLINNSLGWVIFAIATVTYMLTLEPTASFWDCGEFISQGYKLEVGHPPGNPIFMLTANFFTHFASSPSQVALCVNAMSGLLSAGCILLLFWTVTHLVRRLITKDGQEEYSWMQIALIMGSGVCGALAYAWSDTFWFSAVEGEVYAFSSFCTALTFWLILKWENRSEEPHSDRYLVAIAYVIGVSVAVHLLNLLCIPAIILVIYYKKFKETTAKGSLIALLISFGIIVFILFGLVPGFVEIAQYSELLFVNKFGMPFNTGVIAYALIFVGLLVWTVYSFHKQSSANQMRWSFLLTTFFSGILFIGSSMLIPIVLTAALAFYLFGVCKKIPVRILYNTALYIAVIFVGYSSYALILIRSNAQTPMDQNSPDNVFALGSYLNREQYGKTPLLYGPTYASPVERDDTGAAVMTKASKYVKEVKASPDEPDRYKEIDDNYNTEYSYPSSTKMLFPRLYDSSAKDKYLRCMGAIDTHPVETGSNVVDVPTFSENIRYFFQYQLNYMYWRYFLWNFAGRQNDLQGQGEINHGNWISGIPFIDNARLGDQDMLPDDLKNNPGRNVFYMLPLLLGLIGLLWQAYCGKRGIEQFWVVFFLFFMTGIAIVLYLNQTPEQPRERDYAYAGSFYAFAIWIGMGVTGLYKLLSYAVRKVSCKKEGKNGFEVTDAEKKVRPALVVAAVAFGIFVPLQMVSQTWDDHDRSGRYACRDFGMNYLSSVDKDGIIFTSGDNDTFPLWYAQEVEGYRTDVRVVNMSYLATDWYMAQMRRPAYESAPLPMQANAQTFAYDQHLFGLLYTYDVDGNPSFNNPNRQVSALTSIANYYSLPSAEGSGDTSFNYPNMFIPVDRAKIVANGVVPADMRNNVDSNIPVNLLKDQYITSKDGYTLSSAKAMQLDIISSMVAQGWKRPAYFAITIPDEYYSYFENQDGGYKFTTSAGMAYALTPINMLAYKSVGSGYTDKAYRNITEHYRWGGLDKATPGNVPYYDETAARMVNSTRISIVEAAQNLIKEAEMAADLKEHNDSLKVDVPARVMTDGFIADRYNKARTLLHLMEQKLPWFAVNASFSIIEDTASAYFTIAHATGNSDDMKRGSQLMEQLLTNYAQYMRYYNSLSADLKGCLTNIDDYLYQDAGYLKLFETYMLANPSAAKKLFVKLDKQGLNLWYGFERAALRVLHSSSASAAQNIVYSFPTYARMFPKEAQDFLMKHDNFYTVMTQLMEQSNS